MLALSWPQKIVCTAKGKLLSMRVSLCCFPVTLLLGKSRMYLSRAQAEGDRKLSSGKQHLHQYQHFSYYCKGTISSQRQLGQLKNNIYSSIPFYTPLYREIYTYENKLNILKCKSYAKCCLKKELQSSPYRSFNK